MPSEVLEARAAESATPPSRAALIAHWPLLVGFALLAAATLPSLGRQVWTREAGAHGPIVLATGIWLVWRVAGALGRGAKPGSPLVVWPVFGLSLGLWVFGRAFDFISLETAGLYGVGMAMAYAVVGGTALARNWFPFFYLAFLIPPPEWFLDKFTGPLKQFVSYVTTTSLSAAGIPISREGVTIHVAQYSLLVKDACSGMNSLTGLFAISLLYIYLLRGSSFRYSVLLTLFVAPIAVISNIVRVSVLVLITYYLGDAAAQGFTHEMAGIFLFAVALVLVFGVDSVLIRVAPKSWRPA